jgi:hypothetical protein
MPWDNIDRRRTGEVAMNGILWETDFLVALAKAKETGLPIYQDFWFDG